MKARVNIRVDVTKIDKSRLYVGAKGTYLNLTTMIDLDNKDQYDNNGFISEETSKEERESGLQLPILGNCKVSWTDAEPKVGGNSTAGVNPISSKVVGMSVEELDEDIPF
tara:strand:- start:504 stop:833 length:330 start_codon:yes stop_codon:yes gene_type:complete